MLLAAGCADLDECGDSALDPAPRCERGAGSLPNPILPAGTGNPTMPVDHILVIMQENHSFDTYLGRLNAPELYGTAVDGITPAMANADALGKKVFAFHSRTLCVKDTDHSWDAEHDTWNQGRLDRFVLRNGSKAMAYFDSSDLPYYYALANSFAIADRYFASVLGPTFPNRFFLLTGTAFGHVKNDKPKSSAQFAQKTIFDVLDAYGVTWKYYTDGYDYLSLFQPVWKRSAAKRGTTSDYERDLASGALPQVTFLDSSVDEHPPENIQLGQSWVAARVNALMASPAWDSSVLFLTYDENGGFFDHVPPPKACAPDPIAPPKGKEIRCGGYERYGLRVPLIAISPYAKRHYVSHVAYDHSSILKFIETRFNLPALTARDANADAMLDLFDFERPQASLPELPSAEPDARRACP